MTCQDLLKLCDQIAPFSDEEFEVWVQGGSLGDARPITSFVATKAGLILACEDGQPVNSASVCRMKELVGRLREMSKTLGPEGILKTQCFVCCQDDSGSSRYFDFANERPLSFFNHEYLIFALGREQYVTL